jgi:hypothetical protein
MNRIHVYEDLSDMYGDVSDMYGDVSDMMYADVSGVRKIVVHTALRPNRLERVCWPRVADYDIRKDSFFIKVPSYKIDPFVIYPLIGFTP